MYTTNSEKQATRALQVFEQVRYFFLQNSKNKQAPQGRVRIIAFSSEKDYKPYRPNAGTFAYYLQSRARDYIVMQDIETAHHQSAVHEYTHLIVQHMNVELPIWLNEGLADLYSSLEPRGEQALVGRPLPSYDAVLAQQVWIPWNVLFTVDHSSPYYNESEKMSIFYAQSWVLVHMLNMSPRYRDNFSDLLIAIAGGMSAPEALQKIYGRSMAEIGKDAHNYIRQSTLNGALFNVTLPKSSLQPDIADLPDFDVRLALADLLASKKETASEAHHRLNELDQQHPKRAAVQESLGYLAWQQGNVADARKHFALAIDDGSKNVAMMLDYVGLVHGSDVSLQKLVDIVHAAIALEPENRNARMRLAELEIEQHHFSAALAAISEIHTVSPEQAFEFFSVSAYCHANLRDPKGARESADRALKYAKTPSQRLQMSNLLQQLDGAMQLRPPATSVGEVPSTPPTQTATAPAASGTRTLLGRDEDLPRVVAKTKAFECRNGQFRLHVQAGERELIFKMDRLDHIVVRGIENLEWGCGPLKPQIVTVVYKDGDDPKFAGTVAELIF
jgi:Tfp pilus assembly protein PilF